MKKSHSTFLWTFLAVAAGIWLWSKWSRAKVTGGTITFGPLTITPAATNVEESAPFYGPAADPVTGAYNGPGAKTGTVAFSSQSVD